VSLYHGITGILELKRFRSDNGGEYTSEALQKFFKSRGITHQLTAPCTPEQNGKSERLNQIIFEIARTILKYAGMPNRYWAEAALYAVYVKNRIPDKTDISPYEYWTQRTPDLSYMRTFGCKAYVFRPSEARQKLDDKARTCIFLGYAPTTDRQYRLLDITTKRIITASDVVFDENTLYKDMFQQSKHLIKPDSEPMDN
jgi:hypothetical protein